MAQPYREQLPAQQLVRFSDYVQNPIAYIGQRTALSGSIESSNEFNKHKQGSIILKIKLDAELSGAQADQPIHILIEGDNQDKDKCVTYIGNNNTVLNFECFILEKPREIHWFMLISAQLQVETESQCVTFTDYIANPEAHIKQETQFYGKIGDSQDYNPGKVSGKVFTILLDSRKSGEITIEPITVLVEDSNQQNMAEMIKNKRSEETFVFKCKIFKKPPNMHWFELLKVDHDRLIAGPEYLVPGPIKCKTIRIPQLQREPIKPLNDQEKRTFCHLTNKIMTNPVKADDG
ncbi:MAG: hypothetical protein EZS28_039206, partial [Streblomastix strix]